CASARHTAPKSRRYLRPNTRGCCSAQPFADDACMLASTLTHLHPTQDLAYEHPARADCNYRLRLPPRLRAPHLILSLSLVRSPFLGSLPPTLVPPSLPSLLSVVPGCSLSHPNPSIPLIPQSLPSFPILRPPFPPQSIPSLPDFLPRSSTPHLTRINAVAIARFLYPRPGTTLLSDTPAPTPCPRSAAIVAARLPTPTLKRQDSSAKTQAPGQLRRVPRSIVPRASLPRSLGSRAPSAFALPMCCSVSPLIANYAIDQRTPSQPARP
ncbi:hypothetical protein B0H14DRAFT_3606328, partial [Mycena olivaceomarginata]